MIWVVTLNGFVWGVSESAEGADRLMDEVKRQPQFARETWRKVGQDGWSSPVVKSLSRKAYPLEALA